MTGRRFLPVRLPMYDWPEVKAETLRLERALQGALCAVLDLDPSGFRERPENAELVEVWTDPDLLLTQTCGYPLTHALAGRVRLLGAPHYSAPGCDGVTYCSQLVVFAESSHRCLEDLRGRRAVYNGADSQSGMNAFRHAVAGLRGRDGGGSENENRFFSDVVASGSHLGSMRAVAAQEADVACIDAICWWLACREVPDLTARLRPIGRTASVPGLPLITSLRFTDREADLIADTIDAVLTGPETQESRERLGIRGFSKLDVGDYTGLLSMEREAAGLGYPVLA
ncbi:PhnD/SsuA/transferrin family substrate-binding protein [Roseibium sp. AS2]|uniref:phosphate/phosphite/phosphonate ABC transporter substrate-binding protein n=1 Tax=Roseibium sp. AS2 TaxID=3135781 RepID=UPI003172C57D